MQFSHFSQNGQILPIDQATVPLENIEYMYGFGVYESMKVRKGTLYFVKEHVARLFTSASIIELEHVFTRENIIVYIQELVEKLHIDACNIKMLLIGAEEAKNAQLYIIPLAPLFPDRKLYTHGAKVITVSYERWYPHAKSLNMLPSYLAYRKAKKMGGYDGLLVDKEGNILEGTRTNFFAMNGRNLFMAPLERVLEGVTLKTVLHVAKQHGFTVTEKNISLSSLPEYEATFLTSTSSKIVPLRQIDDLLYEEIPAELKELMKLYDEFLNTCGGQYRL